MSGLLVEGRKRVKAADSSAHVQVRAFLGVD
jgi:hypothetical protein